MNKNNKIARTLLAFILVLATPFLVSHAFILLLVTSFLVPYAFAQDWGQFANVSTTMGINAKRICYGESTRGDIGCPADAPTISGSTISGTFVGDGSGLTGVIAAGSDRITSGTAQVIANGNSNSISITEAGVTTGYYYNGIWVAGGVSTTGGISATTGYFSSNTNVNGVLSARGGYGTYVAYPSGSLNIGGGGTTPDRASIAWGDGTGWKLNFGTYISKVFTPLVTFTDTGTNYFGSDPNNRVRIESGLIRMQDSTDVSRSLEIQATKMSLGSTNSKTYSTSNTALLNVWSNGNGTDLIRLGVNVLSNGYVVMTQKSVNNFNMSFYQSGNPQLFLSSGGNIGIGIQSSTVPSTSLHISGTLLIANGGENCDTNRSGAIRYNGSTFQVCYGTGGWANLADASSTVATADRITSGTAQVIANGLTNSISITESGVTTGYYYNGIWVAGGVSTTGPISATDGYFSNNLTLNSNNYNAGFKIQNNVANGYESISFFDHNSVLAATVAYANSGATYLPGSLMMGTRTNAPIIFTAGASTPTERMRITSAGLVGISTTTPSTTLHVVASLNQGQMLDADSQTGSQITIRGRTNTNNRLYIGYNTDSDYARISAITEGTAYRPLLLTASGVGINTASPTTALQVSGTLRIANGAEACDANRSGAIRYVSGSTFQVCYGTGGWANLTDASGTTTTADRIISGTAQMIANGTTNSISITEAGVTTGYYYNGIWVAGGVSTTGPISGSTGYFSSNVGINTPSQANFGLSLPASSTLTLGTMTAARLVVGYGGDPNAFGSYSTTQMGNALTIMNGGEIRFFGPGSVGASMRFAMYAPASYELNIDTPGTASVNRLRFRQTSTGQLRTSFDGIVGIGTSNTLPSTTLHVSGTIRIADSGEACDTNRSGAIRYSSANSFDFCDGTNGWRSLATMAAAGTSPTDRITSGTSVATMSPNGTLTVRGLIDLVTGTGTINIGQYAGQTNVGQYLTSLGYSAGQTNTGNYVTTLGSFAGQYNTGHILTAVGYSAAQSNTAANVTTIGYQSAISNTGNFLTAIGYRAARFNTNINVTALGYQAADSNTGAGATAVGFGAALANTGDYLTAVGLYAAYNNSGTQVTAVGYQAAISNSGSNLTAMGYNAARSNTGAGVTAVGNSAALSNSGTNVTAMGHQSGINNIGNYLTAYGYYTARSNSGVGLTAMGYQAADNNSGTYLTAMGYAAALNNSANYTTALGYQAGNTNTGVGTTAVGYGTGQNNSGAYLTALGYGAGLANTGDNVIAIGRDAARYNTVSNVTALGYLAVNTGVSNTFSNVTGLGYNAQPTTSNQVKLGDNNITSVSTSGIYYGAGLQATGTVTATAFVGDGSGLTNLPGGATDRITSGTSVATISPNGTLTVRGLLDIVTDTYVVAVGKNAGGNNSGTALTAVGYMAGLNNNGISNTMVGYGAGYLNTNSNVSAFGYYAGRSNLGTYLTAIGYQAAYLNTGDRSTAIGTNSGFNNTGIYLTSLGFGSAQTNTGNFLTAVGYNAGQNNSATYVTALGYMAGYNNTFTNVTVLGNAAVADKANQVVLGNPSVVEVSTSGVYLGKGVSTTGTVTASTVQLADNPATPCGPSTYGTIKMINGRQYTCRP